MRWIAIAILQTLPAGEPVAAGDAGRRLERAAPTVHWPQFRGAHARGVALGSTPTHWDATTGRNILWKSPVPGLGHSSPIIWGDRIFLTSCISGVKDPELRVGLYGEIVPVNDNSEHTWHVYCLDKNTGKILWERQAHSGVPKIKRHTKATHANSTPATDGRYVIAFFGSEGLYCYTVDGELLWKRDFGVLDAGYWKLPEAQWEFGSSPIIYKNKVILQVDIHEGPYIAAWDLKTGKPLWKTERPDVAPSWATPGIWPTPSGDELVANASVIRGYDPENGRELWSLGPTSIQVDPDQRGPDPGTGPAPP